MVATILPVSRSRLLLLGCIGIVLGLGVSPASAQAALKAYAAPSGGFYLGIGGLFNSANFGSQSVYAKGTSNVYDGTGALVEFGSAAGPPAPIFMNSQDNFAPTFQGGYFQHFANSPWLWGAKFSYDYLNATATTQNALIPQFGSFTTVSSGAVTPFTGNAFVAYAQTTVRQQFAFVPFIGHALSEKSFVYLGAGPTLSQLRTNLNGLVGFADVNGQHTDVSGAPQSFSGSNWAWGGTATVGLTYFLGDSWFLDFNYAYAQTANQTANFASTFINPNGSNGTTISGTLVGNSTWHVIDQSAGVTINKLF